MATTRETIDHVTLERLVEAGAVRGANIVGQPGGWGVVIQYGMTERALAARRGAVRIFRKFETLVSYLKDMGISRYQVDASQFDPVVLKTERKRSDAAERLKAAHEAAAHDKWFREQVDLALAEADDPATVWVSHADVKNDMAKQRTELLARVECRL